MVRAHSAGRQGVQPGQRLQLTVSLKPMAGPMGQAHMLGGQEV